MIKEFIKYIIIILSYLIRRDNKSKVIYYHDIGFDYTTDGTDADLIKKQIRKLKKCGYTFVSHITEPENQLMVCFDDGWRGLYEHKELFINEGIYPTIFIAVELIGKDGYMSKDQLQELAGLGFRLQSHTYSHQDLGVMNRQELIHELKDSREKLQEMFNLPFDEICFPMGRFSNLTLEESKNAGYTLMFTSLEGGYYDNIDSHLTYRYFLQSMPACMSKYYVRGFSKILYNRAYHQHFVNAN